MRKTITVIKSIQLSRFIANIIHKSIRIVNFLLFVLCKLTVFLPDIADPCLALIKDDLFSVLIIELCRRCITVIALPCSLDHLATGKHNSIALSVPILPCPMSRARKMRATPAPSLSFSPALSASLKSAGGILPYATAPTAARL